MQVQVNGKKKIYEGNGYCLYQLSENICTLTINKAGQQYPTSWTSYSDWTIPNGYRPVFTYATPSYSSSNNFVAIASDGLIYRRSATGSTVYNTGLYCSFTYLIS